MTQVISQYKCPHCPKVWILRHDGGAYAEFVEISYQIGFKMHVLMEHGQKIKYDRGGSVERRAV